MSELKLTKEQILEKVNKKLIAIRFEERRKINEERERKKYESRCLEALICPNCGGDLKRITLKDWGIFEMLCKESDEDSFDVSCIITCDNNDYKKVVLKVHDFDD